MADDADLKGKLQIENSPSNIGFWTNAADTASWKLLIPSSGADYTVKLEYACDKGTGGATFDIVGSPTSKVTGVVAETGSWTSYTTMDVAGTLHLDGGEHTLTIVVTNKPGGAVMNLRRIILTPK
jgi:hypothetical protein